MSPWMWCKHFSQTHGSVCGPETLPAVSLSPVLISRQPLAITEQIAVPSRPRTPAKIAPSACSRRRRFLGSVPAAAHYSAWWRPSPAARPVRAADCARARTSGAPPPPHHTSPTGSTDARVKLNRYMAAKTGADRAHKGNFDTL